jgi:transcriptional regulator with XRE-family HTH domain
MQEKKTINVEVGANIKAARERVGLTQEQLSERVGIGVKSLSAIERGTVGVSLTTLRKICEELSVSADALLFGAGEKGDVSDIVACVERMTPEQLNVTRDMLRVLMAAFGEE